ncbi:MULTISPECIES: hypothetical protein [Thermoactinomyces]|jgi:hypothetical protein|uniref:Uncharacterized protein n=1 Tax=Thermoactinomyces daqus TaxID=1329516 RepID=A0A7W1X7Y8_9BACL|nr:MULTISPECIES: hypothetical protein [Thermoactinomyces]MBA4541715.1 hypothetical protein [Thermoactinomyces daqus]MBH8597200.1 hypothetical protein [Thermoactinomyces sp. CICC 10523]MBH8602760.1 hypothetical protein [Thermoactinomyces sp. CICC 10522]
MKVFTHGSNINFACSAREMTGSELERLIHEYQQEYRELLFGKIDLEQSEIYVYGTLEEAVINEDGDRCRFRYRSEQGEGMEEHPFDQLLLSQEAHFDIIDEKKGRTGYRVLYVTFLEDGEDRETSYFFADANGVSQPLACVAEFWQQVIDIGRDVDFTMTGCSRECGCE